MPDIRTIEFQEIIKFCERDLRKPFSASAVNECPRLDDEISDAIRGDSKLVKNTTRDIIIPEVLHQWIFLGGFSDLVGQSEHIGEKPGQGGYGFICSYSVGIKLDAELYTKAEELANHRTVYQYFLRFLKTPKTKLLNEVINSLAKNERDLSSIREGVQILQTRSYENMIFTFGLDYYLSYLNKIDEFLTVSGSFNANSDAQSLLDEHRESLQNLRSKVEEYNALGRSISEIVTKFDKQKTSFFEFDGVKFAGSHHNLRTYEEILANSFVKKRMKQLRNEEHVFGS